jgi:hypothetical protein
MSEKSPIYKYAKKKGIRENDEHDVLLDILKAGRNGKTLQKLKNSVREYSNDLPRIIPGLIKKGVIISKGNKFIGVFSSMNINDGLIYKALATVLEAPQKALASAPGYFKDAEWVLDEIKTPWKSEGMDTYLEEDASVSFYVTNGIKRAHVTLAPDGVKWKGFQDESSELVKEGLDRLTEIYTKENIAEEEIGKQLAQESKWYNKLKAYLKKMLRLEAELKALGGDVIKFPMKKIDLENGDKIRLTKMDDPYNPIKPGTEGVVTNVNKISEGQWQVSVKWEGSNSRLMMAVPEDEYEKI